MERPPPPDLDAFTAPLTAEGQAHSAFIWNPGASTYVVCVVYGPDAHEVQTVCDQLQMAGVDILKWGVMQAPPDDLA